MPDTWFVPGVHRRSTQYLLYDGKTYKTINLLGAIISYAVGLFWSTNKQEDLSPRIPFAR
jgi:hypothetical protein